MYATCLYCHASLGTNNVIEALPVGRQLAFDAAKGRLWVVCLHCSRWNLSPIEERWEAIEACERAFRASRRRVSSDNIAFAHLSEGLELVRIGDADHAEFAAWRYGREFARRRRNTYWTVGAIAAVSAGVFALRHLSPALYGLIPAAGAIPNLSNVWHLYRQNVRGVARVPDERGQVSVVRGIHVAAARLISDDAPEGWALHVQHANGNAILHGALAERTLGSVMTHVNRTGGSPATIRRAASRLGDLGDADRMMQVVAGTLPRPQRDKRSTIGSLVDAPIEDRLAIEMALHEDTERAALHGQLDALREAWREAEAIAAIADNLLMPEWIGTRLRAAQVSASLTNPER
jgi:hypothetical protein